MTATIQHFTRALLTPDLSLATLSDARAVTDRGSPKPKSNGAASGGSQPCP